MSAHTVSGLEIYAQLTGVPTRSSRQLQHSLRALRDRMIAGEDYLPVSACIPVRRAMPRWKKTETKRVSVFRHGCHEATSYAKDPFASIVGLHILMRSSEAETKCKIVVTLRRELYLPAWLS